jgi:putative oxidoreductase
MRKLLFLASAQSLSDFTLLLLRVFVGLFLIWNVWDNIVSPERMRDFEEFLSKHHFAAPTLFAPISVYVQFVVGIAFVLGFFTRWAGILCAVHFIVAIVMVDRFGGMRGIFPPGVLVAIGCYLATHGAGRFSIDAGLRANEVPRTGGGVRLKK